MSEKFSEDLSKVLYTADQSTVENLLGQLARPEHDRTRWGDPDGDHHLRGVAADALQDNGRDREADHLRSGRHVMVQDGKVVPARFNLDNFVNRYAALEDMMDEHTGGDHEVWWEVHYPPGVSSGASHAMLLGPEDDYEPHEPLRAPEFKAELLRRLDAYYDRTNPGAGWASPAHQDDYGDHDYWLRNTPVEEPIPEGP